MRINKGSYRISKQNYQTFVQSLTKTHTVEHLHEQYPIRLKFTKKDHIVYTEFSRNGWLTIS